MLLKFEKTRTFFPLKKSILEIHLIIQRLTRINPSERHAQILSHDTKLNSTLRMFT